LLENRWMTRVIDPIDGIEIIQPPPKLQNLIDDRL
jgi:hypothetical protein